LGKSAKIKVSEKSIKQRIYKNSFDESDHSKINLSKDLLKYSKTLKSSKNNKKIKLKKGKKKR